MCRIEDDGKYIKVVGDESDASVQLALDCLRKVGASPIFANYSIRVNNARRDRFHQIWKAANAQTKQQAVPAPSRTSTYRGRIMVAVDSPVRPADTVTDAAGNVLRFTGYGRDFYARGENLQDPSLEGLLVRYAYYA